MSLRFQLEDPRVNTLQDHIMGTSVCHYAKAEVKRDTIEYTLAPKLGVFNPDFAKRFSDFIKLGQDRGKSLVVILDKVATLKEQEESFEQTMIELLCSVEDPCIPSHAEYDVARNHYNTVFKLKREKGPISGSYSMHDGKKIFAIGFSNHYHPSYPRFSPEPMIVVNRAKIFNDVPSVGRDTIRTKFRVNIFRDVGRKPVRVEMDYLKKGFSPLYFPIDSIVEPAE